MLSDDRLLALLEIEQLHAWALRAIAQGKREGALTVALLGTAARRFEAAALRCEDIRMGTLTPIVHFPKVKGGGEASVPISPETYAVLTAWKQGRAPKSPLIPTEKGAFMHTTTLWRLFREALRAAGIDRDLGVHSTRHAAGFLILRATNDITKVQAFLRHASTATTSTWYKHVYLPDLSAALTKAGI
jgi:integrase/recombinase XerD